MRIVLCFLLALVVAPAWAKWAKVSESEDRSLAVYIDPASIRKDGNFRKVWQITDQKQRDKDGKMSGRALVEYDCKEERGRLLAASSHSEPMAGGETLSSFDYSDREWFAIPPDSLSARVLKIVCASVAAPDLAKWVKVSESDTSIHYLDPDSIRKDGNLRKMWQITDLKQRDKDGVMSWRAWIEYDCKEERHRLLSLSSHSNPMAGGVTLWSSEDPDKWQAIPPGSVTETVFKFVCASVAAPDLAKWVKVSASGDGSVAGYIDPASIHKNGNFRKVWLIQDLKQRDEDGKMPWRAWIEYDCKEERSRLLSLSGHSDDKWSAILPGSVTETVFKFVCAK